MTNKNEMNATSVQVFHNTQFGEIRVIKEKFCLVDVCKILGLTTPSRVKDRLNQKGVTTTHTLTAGGSQSMLFIDEPNLYRCIFQSRKPNAEKFQDWVTSEVLPAIRQTGGYVASHADDTPEMIMARALQVAQQTIERHTQQLALAENTIKEQAPKVQYFDRVLQSTSTYTSTQVGKELGMSAIALEKRLHQKGIIFKQSGQWMPYAKYQGCGYTKPRTHHYPKSDGTTGSNTITVWTEEGREFIHNLIKEGGVL